jgi:hypothetical protein
LEHEGGLSTSIFENKGGDFIFMHSTEKREFQATERNNARVPEIAYGLLIHNLSVHQSDFAKKIVTICRHMF